MQIWVSKENVIHVKSMEDRSPNITSPHAPLSTYQQIHFGALCSVFLRTCFCMYFMDSICILRSKLLFTSFIINLFLHRNVWACFSFWIKSRDILLEGHTPTREPLRHRPLLLGSLAQIEPPRLSKEETSAGSDAWDRKSETKTGCFGKPRLLMILWISFLR